jgi:hypothetical protein
MPDPGHGGVVMILAKGLDVRGGHGQRGELPRAARDAGQAQEVEPGPGPVRGAVEFRIQVVERPIVLRGPRQLCARVASLGLGYGSPGGGRSKKHPGEHETDRECDWASWLSHSRLTAFHVFSFHCKRGTRQALSEKGSR